MSVQPLTGACDRTYTAQFHGGQRPLEQIVWLVLHDTEGSTALSAARYFASGERNGSAHFCIDANHCYRTLPPTTVAYAAFSPANELGLHFEQAGFASWTREQWLTLGRGTIERCAVRVAFWSRQLGIPLRSLSDGELQGRRKPGVTTHAQITRAFPGPGHTHTDPGRGYPLDVLLERAQHWEPQL